MKKLPENSIDLIFTDPPYALGSDVIILPNGKPEYKKARDFMDKWNQPSGIFWEEWFKEAKRILKHGGHCLVFGLDRQLMLYKYYACFSGFVEKQSLYWYFISNFPKAVDLSKNIDKYFGELAQKYDGYKYSIAPLKQTNETILVFQKEYKTGSCLHDTLSMENGDDTITCGALDIEKNRVVFQNISTKGRFPSQTFCDLGAAKILDEQSGIEKRKGQSLFKTKSNVLGKDTIYQSGFKPIISANYNDTAGCSKALHICDYEQGEYDIYNYSGRTSQKERGENNNHPTVKPQRLLRRILSYFKTPNQQIVLDCFVGSGSIPIACIHNNMQYIGYELNPEYYEIAKQRIENAYFFAKQE